MIISGHSDDCIIVTGKNIEEEFYLVDNNSSFITLQNGMVIRCTFSESEDVGWRFFVMNNSTDGSSVSVKEEGPDDRGDYRLVFDNYDSKYVWFDWSKDGPTVKQALNTLEVFDSWHKVPGTALIKIYEILRQNKIVS